MIGGRHRRQIPGTSQARLTRGLRPVILQGMNANAGVQFIEKNVVLVGAGNAHLVFVKRFGMRPIPGVAVTLVSESGQIPYSAMVPGHIAGDYRQEEVTIDLVRLCRWAGVRSLADRVTGIDVGT